MYVITHPWAAAPSESQGQHGFLSNNVVMSIRVDPGRMPCHVAMVHVAMLSQCAGEAADWAKWHDLPTLPMCQPGPGAKLIRPPGQLGA